MFNFFGGKKGKEGKKGNFFLELDEEKQASQTASTTTEETAQPVVETAPEAAPQAAQPVPEKKSKKSKKPSAKRAAKAPEAQPAPVAAATAIPSSGNGKAEPQSANFATTYYLTTSMSRRRPGPSLNPFKEMALQVKTPTSKG
jgi:hypothetical protein